MDKPAGVLLWLQPVPPLISDLSLPLLLFPSPLISFHSHSVSDRWLSRDPFSPHPSLPHTSVLPYQIPDWGLSSKSLNVLPQTPIQITVFPSFFSLLTSTRSTRWWRNNTDTWSYSICALGPGPKSIVISGPPGIEGPLGGGVYGVLAHHSAGADFLKGFKNRGCYKWYLQRTHLLPGPRFPRAQFDVPCNQLIPSCKGRKSILLQKLPQGPVTVKVTDVSINHIDIFYVTF